MERQRPRVAAIDSLTATLYYSGRQARGDRCTIALQRRRIVAGEGVSLGDWMDLDMQVTEMDKESTQLLNCDFDLVLKEELPAQLAPLPAPQLTARGAVRARPGIVTAIQEDGLAGAVTAERFASGTVIGIRDHWRCRVTVLARTFINTRPTSSITGLVLCHSTRKKSKASTRTFLRMVATISTCSWTSKTG